MKLERSLGFARWSARKMPSLAICLVVLLFLASCSADSDNDDTLSNSDVSNNVADNQGDNSVENNSTEQPTENNSPTDENNGEDNNNTDENNGENNNNNPEDPVDGFDLPNAMGFGGHDMLPWPADQYIDIDANGTPVTASDASILPRGFTPKLIAGSGASRISSLVTWLPESIDPRTLPDKDNWGATLEQDSSVRVIVIEDDAEPVAWPVLAEMDALAPNPGRASLIIRAHRPFPAGAQVVVGLRNSLKSFGCYQEDHPEMEFPFESECMTYEQLPALTRIIEGQPETDAEKAWMGRGRDAIMAALPHLSDAPEELIQAWSFTVRSKDEVIDPLVQMQQIAAQADSSSYVLEDIEYQDNRALIYGDVDVPWFLNQDNEFEFDDDGNIIIQETRPARFLVTIPNTVSESRPVVLFGHGFFSSIEEPTWGNLFNGLIRWEMSAITTPFYGFAEGDMDAAVSALSASTLEGLPGIINQQLQSQANFTVVHNMVKEHLGDTLTVDFGEGEFAPLDGSQIPYMGISNGGSQGLVIMATSPVLTRGALVVPGGAWSHMLQRATHWNSLGALFAMRYTNHVEMQLGTAMLQHAFDPVDSLNYVEHLIHDRLPGMPENPDILMVEALHDSQVSNMVTRWIGGTAKVPVITPSVEPVWDTPTVDADTLETTPSNVGYEIYDLEAEPHPPGNLAPEENRVHNDVRLLDTYREQMGIFLEEGRVVRSCDGPCIGR